MAASDPVATEVSPTFKCGCKSVRIAIGQCHTGGDDFSHIIQGKKYHSALCDQSFPMIHGIRIHGIRVKVMRFILDD